ncbi:type VI secretion system-associated protein TagF [Acidisoma cellulosilytica]|uniref:Type VI secretion system-associated protein TagF n=1 Tax=Acidisoma cellulosilyticum TaxID=2802395 RepID=A0A963Z1R6_9PROT|nr:type VI secretion system-associated protein TagF [Acidisoma cellulosilyticum]MCB8881031.1 type VI secretion system-associated protein TagF [Acidisoma cellulosilyticum]
MDRDSQADATAAVFPGFFGKLPSRGDFVGRGLSALTVSALDAWASQSLNAALAQLAEDWGPVWAAAPVWHFTLPPGQCGPYGLRGLFYPSMDKVGRRFPLIAAAELPRSDQQHEDSEAEANYHDALEDICRHVLAHDLAPDVLFAQLSTIAAPDVALPPIGQWWTAGADHVPAGGFECETLPDRVSFMRMLQD